MPDGFVVTKELVVNHPRWRDYPLLPGDLLVKPTDDPTTYTKTCPGLMIHGFRLTPEQEATLKPTEYQARGLDFYYDYPET